MDVLDLGCGDGTTALPAAALGANVLGVDIAANLVAAGQERAVAAGLDNVTFQQGDATDLGGFDDESFDLNRVVMANWIPATRPSSRRSSRSPPPTRPRRRKGSSAR